MSLINFIDYEECTWKEFAVGIEGADIIKIRGLKYEISSEDEHLHAKGDEAISIQSGNITGEGSIKLLKGAVDDINTAAKLAKARSILDLRFTITATYLPKDERVLRTDTLTGCKVNKLPFGWDQGAKYMELELPFKFLKRTSLP